MLPPSLRLLVRHRARSVPLQLQRCLNSTDTRPNGFADFAGWAQNLHGVHRVKQSHSDSGGAQRDGPSKKRKKKTPGSKPPHSTRKNPSSAMTRERRIIKTILGTSRYGWKPPPTIKNARDLPTEDWGADDWGLDKLKPPPSDRGLVVGVEEPGGLGSTPGGSGRLPGDRIRGSDVEYTRRLEGVLTPLGSPVLQDVAPLAEHRPIATLAHKLDRVLFNPGVHWLQEPRSGVYNFTPWLQNIPDVNKFAFERLPPFVKSSRDKDLLELAKRERRIFGGSTSSLTGMLSQVYFLISGFRTPDTSLLSQPFRSMPGEFTPGQRMPAAVRLNYKDGTYAIDSAPGERDDPDKNILVWLGTLLEKFLTMPPEEFRRLLRDSPNPAPDSGEFREAYRYAKSRRFVMRSQLDCHDPRLPGTGVFDLKTRAVLPVRMDIMNYKQHSTYPLRTLQGELESFEREYHDLMRSAFLKYSFQARIGNMDGILVAHHNTARVFGFRYIPLSEMDACLFGGEDRGDAVFEKCVLLLEEILMEVIGALPDQTVRCLFETRGDELDVFVEPEAHDESKGPRPITHIVVQSTSYVDGNRTNGENAVANPGTWNLRWSVTHSSLSQEEKEYKLHKARERQWRAYSLPPGVSVEEMEEIWDQIDFSGKQRLLGGTPVASSRDGGSAMPSSSGMEKESTFDPSFFLPPSKHVQDLRELSMKGKAEMELMLEKAKGRPKLIWGEAEAYIDRFGSDEVPTETEVAGANEVVGEPLVRCEEGIPVDEDIRANEATAPLADYGRAPEEDRQ